MMICQIEQMRCKNKQLLAICPL